jgi:transcriptional regulator
MGHANKDQLLGSIDLLILKALAAGALHGYGIAARIRAVSSEALRVEEGSLYPALHRMEQSRWIASSWRISETNRRARYYALTTKGRRQLEAEQKHWSQVTAAVDRFLRFA